MSMPWLSDKNAKQANFASFKAGQLVIVFKKIQY